MVTVIDATIPFLCQCGKDVIEVNKVTTLSKYNPVYCELSLSLVSIKQDIIFYNDKELTADAINEMVVRGETVKSSYIILEIPFGNKADSFIDTSEVEMSVSAPGWACSKWIARDETLICTITKNSAVANMDQFESIDVEINRICSYSMPGMTYIKVKFINIAGMDDMLKIINIIKKKAKLQINKFFPSDSKYVISPKEKVKLMWQTGASTGGIIHPMEYVLDSKISECIDSPVHSTDYIIDARDELSNTTQLCPIFVSPPVIATFQVDAEEKNLSWSTLYGTKVQLNDVEVEPTMDKYNITNKIDKVSLMVEGYLCNRKRTLYMIKMHQELELLLKTELFFANYTIVQLEWNSSYKAVKLSVCNPERFLMVYEKTGFWEYVSKIGVDLNITFIGIKENEDECRIPL